MSGFLSLIQGGLTSLRVWFVVAPWEQGVRVRGGKRAKLMRPGFHWCVPFVDRIYRVSVRLRLISDTGQTVTTLDGHPVTYNIAIQFSVRDALQLFNAVANPEATIIQRAASAIAHTIAKTNMRDLSLDIVEKQATVSVPLDWGLSDISVRVVSFASVRTYRLMQHEYRSLSGLDVELSKAGDAS